MKDPIENVKIHLREAGAIYRGGGTKQSSQYIFPDGEIFVFERKANNPTIDSRVAMRKLNQVLEKRDASTVTVQEVTVPLPPKKQGNFKPLNPLKSNSIKERWEAAIVQAKAAYEKLLLDAELADKRVKMLESLTTYIDDPTFADTMRAVLPPLEPIVVPPPPPPQPPQEIRVHVEVTRDLVYAATQTFDKLFTVNDVLLCMLNGRTVDQKEHLRIRNSVAGAMMSLYERGQLNRERQGIGRQQSIWSKAVPQSRETVEEELQTVTV